MSFSSVAGAVAAPFAAVYNALTPRSKLPSGKIYLYYFPLAGRAELCKLIAAAGGLELEVSKPGSDVIKAEYGSPSGLPLLSHGDLKLSQSNAIEKYLIGLVPKFASLTPAQQATDHMFACMKEDLLVGCAKVVFTGPKLKVDGPIELPKHLDKWLDVIEGLLPAEVPPEPPTLSKMAARSRHHLWAQHVLLPAPNSLPPHPKVM